MSNADLTDFVPKDRTRAGSGGTLAFVTAFTWGLVVVILAVLVPKLDAVFQDFGVELGGAANLVVLASRIPLVFAGVALILLLVDRPVRDLLSRGERNRWMARAWSFSMVSLPFLALAYLVASLFVPLVGLIGKLSG